MKKFQFGLDSVLGYRQQVLEGRQNEYARTLQKVAQQQDRVDDAQARYQDLNRRFREEAAQGIEVTPTLLERLGDSVERAEAKGATNILALDQSLAAFIVNVPNNRVITALSQAEMKESIFTNIDGAVFL